MRVISFLILPWAFPASNVQGFQSILTTSSPNPAVKSTLIRINRGSAASDPPRFIALHHTPKTKELFIQRSVDLGALTKYLVAITTQVSLFYGLFRLVDQLVATYALKIPFAATAFSFYFITLKSRLLNPLANNRPRVKTLEKMGEAQRRMPSWTPPGFVFPIVWLLLIGPLRAVTTAMIYQSTHSLAHPAIMSLILHLSIGDVWNTINNVERRYGTSVLGVLCVWLSAANAAFQYYRVVPLAGRLLSLKLIWLTVASSLITATWRLNPDLLTGKPEPLYPVTGKASTQFVWFSSSS